MDENKKLNILKDRKLDRQKKNKSKGVIRVLAGGMYQLLN